MPMESKRDFEIALNVMRQSASAERFSRENFIVQIVKRLGESVPTDEAGDWERFYWKMIWVASCAMLAAEKCESLSAPRKTS